MSGTIGVIITEGVARREVTGVIVKKGVTGVQAEKEVTEVKVWNGVIQMKPRIEVKEKGMWGNKIGAIEVIARIGTTGVTVETEAIEARIMNITRKIDWKKQSRNMKIGERSNGSNSSSSNNKRERIRNRKLFSRKSQHSSRKVAVQTVLQEYWWYLHMQMIPFSQTRWWDIANLKISWNIRETIQCSVDVFQTLDLFSSNSSGICLTPTTPANQLLYLLQGPELCNYSLQGKVIITHFIVFLRYADSAG